ncbi:Arginase/deacetylase [Gymnopus androsaceus JB14]|uniref:Arginase/deacetylase n=1 Tax=Gymnopus androsaceus JB14 TaxID=1447944 RepID=A0A6A4HR33_9AGAR|nr:Arginase/deacetylase [Gymnopus androsaceus JB14]
MASASIFIQDACYQHRYIRSRDTSLIVERPERLTAVKVGLAAALTRIQEVVGKPAEDPNDLAAALNKLTLGSQPSNLSSPIQVIHSSATLDLLSHPAVQFAHAFPDPTTEKDPQQYLANLKKWSEESIERISKGESEIPQGLAQGDLYLCPESLNAIQGALATVCESVDHVVDPTLSKRAFVAIRPPGHHCGESTPSGFCFVNNVVVAAAHAHLKHGIHRVVIFDVDLHHGNGTQSLVWDINEETQRQKLEAEARAEAEGSSSSIKHVPGLQIFYSSIHDILSYPCEDGTLSLVQAASMSIAGAHGQWIENVHLQKYEEGGFWELYERDYKSIIRKAENFVQSTATDDNEEVLHEYSSMSRHGRRVPSCFYAQFTKDARVFADKYAKGRIVSVLEGGYSDRALVSGTFAHFCALGLPDEHTWNETWWDEANLVKLEEGTKLKSKKPKGRASGPSSFSTPDSEQEPWVKQTLAFFQHLEPIPFKTIRRSKAGVVEPSSRTLRQRKVDSVASSLPTSSKSTPAKGDVIGKGKRTAITSSPTSKAKQKKREVAIVDNSDEEGSDSSSSAGGSITVPPRKLPRVILKLGPRPNS